MELMRFLLRSSPANLLVVVIASAISGGLGGALIAVVTRAFAQHGVRAWTIVLAFVAVVASRIVGQFIAGSLLVRVAQETVLGLTRRLCDQILRAPYDEVEAMGTPRVLAALTEDVGVLSSAMLALPTLITSLAMLVGCAIYVAHLSWKVFAACMIAAAVGLVGNQALLRRAEAPTFLAREVHERLFAAFKTLTEGLKELKLHRARRDDFMQREIDDSAEELRHLSLLATTRYLLAHSWNELLFYSLIGALLFIAPAATKLSTAALTGYVFAALYMMSPMSSVLGTMPVFLKGRVSLAKIRQIGVVLDSMPAEPVPEHPICAPTPVRLELRGVTYSYPRRESDEPPFSIGPIDLSLSSGEIVFIAGGNGSGKSTLVKLLTGLYAPAAGEIRLGGVLIGPLEREAYRECFAAVFADYHLFNALFGIDTATRGAEIHEYLQLLRLERKVSVRGGRFSSTALSSGQRKRLALLTAFLESRPVYVFDEWAADQDPAYKEVFYLKVLPQLRSAGKCVVVVTHDDRYFHVGDRVLKLEAGQPIGVAMAPAENVARLSTLQPKHESFA